MCFFLKVFLRWRKNFLRHLKFWIFLARGGIGMNPQKSDAVFCMKVLSILNNLKNLGSAEIQTDLIQIGLTAGGTGMQKTDRTHMSGS